jgi:trk system potassium uptake protein TrkH
MSFGLTALLGTLLLSLPIAHRNPLAEISAVDSLFTAVSAVCVTGLTVDNVAATYSPFGQGVLFALFQAGGLGIMALSSAVAILAGRRLQARSSAMLAEMVDAESLASLRRTLRAIVLYTLGIELVGALLLWALFSQSPASVLGPDLAGAGGTLWAAVFHSVSAFCNAGFSVFATGTEPFAGSWPISLAFVVLIIIGGFGFPVLDELGRQLRARLRKERPNRLSLHCRVVLATTAILLGLGLITFLGLEWSGAMRGFDPSERLLTALFQSATMRTAGFQTLDFSAMGAATWMIVCLFMFIGAAPGSTGGGVKVTTLTVLFAAFRAELRGQRPQLFDRAVPLTIVRRASGVFFLSVTFVAAAIFTLLLTEKLEPMKVTFEAFSAFATVGLSTGITPELSTAGRLVVTATMFVGRIGPLTLAIALAIRPTAARFRVPEERVVIG